MIPPMFPPGLGPAGSVGCEECEKKQAEIDRLRIGLGEISDTIDRFLVTFRKHTASYEGKAKIDAMRRALKDAWS